MQIDPKIAALLSTLSDTRKQTYILYQIEEKKIDEICLNRGLSPSTIHSHLEDAILNGLPIDFNRLGITIEQINSLEVKIREPPICSNISKITVIKEQVPEISYDNLKIMVALLKRKYGLCRDDLDTKASKSDADLFNQKQGIIHIQRKPLAPTNSNQTANFIKSEDKNASLNQSPKSRELPSWMKRQASNHDIKNITENNQNASVSTTNAIKKKPRLL
jgi:Werner syndrome ATP-dependent helicase